MAELTTIEEKLAEVLGLAQAAQGATDKVGKLVEQDEVAQTLERMGKEAAETERRATEVAAERDGKKTAIEEKARETKTEAQEMMDTYLGDDADGLDGLEFLIMAEAGELGHVEIVNQMTEQAGDEQLREFAQWALELQQRHFEDTRKCALTVAASEDPNETEG
jgi:DNA-directed RNA polymerase beta' subunit